MPETSNVPPPAELLDGLRHLAFAPVNDAVSLLTRINELDPNEIAGLDLFALSEIKWNKEGLPEFKFYDRLKAFELLVSYVTKQEAPDAASSFYGALESAAKSACDANEV